MVSGATRLATQYDVDRELQVSLSPARRAGRRSPTGAGTASSTWSTTHGVGDRASIATAIRSCQLLLFAPLESAPFQGLG